MFEHKFVTLPKIEESTVNGKRHYVTPDGVFPSMTTVISKVLTSDAIGKWQKRVGDDYAKNYTAMIGRRGTNFHKICENYLMNVESCVDGFMPDAQFLYRQSKPYLDKITNIYALEAGLYSHALRVAGRCDLIASYEGSDLAVIDHKQGTIYADTIDKSMIQLAGYAFMYGELTGVVPTKLVLLYSHIDDGPTEVVKYTEEYSHKLIDTIKKYYLDLQGQS